MKNLILVLTISTVFFQSITACSCFEIIEQFCPSLHENKHVILGEVLSIEGEFNETMQVRVIDQIQREVYNDTIEILGQDGLNCGQWLMEFTIGDSLILSLDSVGIFNVQTEEYLDWYIDGCDLSYLRYSDGLVAGNITADIDQMNYADFVSSIGVCVEESRYGSLQDFAPVGANWKVRGMNMTDSHQGLGINCETSGCGGSHWLYEVNRKEVVGGKICQIIEVSFGEDYNDLSLVEEYAVYEEDDKVYFYADQHWDPNLQDSFYLMMDYNLEVGDTLYNYSPWNASNYSVNYGGFYSGVLHSQELIEVDTIMIGLRDYPRYTFKYADLETTDLIYSKVVRGIGNLGPVFGDGQWHTDEIECEGSFICYQDPLKKYSVFGEDCPCQFQDEITSTEDLASDLDIKIAPNPTLDRLTISTDIMIEAISIIDIHGQEYLSTEAHDEQITLDVESLNQGIYIVKVSTEHGIIAKQFVKL